MSTRLDQITLKGDPPRPKRLDQITLPAAPALPLRLRSVIPGTDIELREPTAASAREAGLGGLFPVAGSPGAALATAGRGITAPDNAKNAILNYLATAAKQRGPGALADPNTLREAGLAGWRALGNLEKDVPPRFVRTLTGQQRGKSSRLGYNLAATADFVLGALTDPSTAIMGPAAEVVGPPIKAGVKALAKAGTGAVVRTARAGAPGLVQKAADIGTRVSTKTTQAQAALASKLPQVGLGPAQAPDEVTRLGNQAFEILARVTGAVKKGYVSNPATIITNAGSNLAISEIAARRAGVNPALLLKEYAPAIKEAIAYGQGRVSKDIAEFSTFSNAFHNTLAQTTQVQGVGPGRKIVQTLAKIPNALTDVQGLSERAQKLALYKTLRPKVGPEKAARLVEQHLYDYEAMPAVLQALDKYGLKLFVTFPYKSAILFGQTLVERPDLLARYPRLKRMLIEELGAEEGYARLKEHQRGPFVVPIGQDRFINLGRFHPFAQAMEATGGLLRGKSPIPGSAEEVADALLGGSIVGGLAPLANRDLLGHRPFLQPGTPPDEQLPQQLRGVAAGYSPSMLPPFGRGYQRLTSAAEGRPPSPGPYAERQPLFEAALQTLVGVPTYRSEDPDARKERLAPQVDARAAVSGAYVDQIETDLAAGRAALPEMEQHVRWAMARRDKPGFLKKAFTDARRQFRDRLTEARNFDRTGRLTAEGQRQIRNSFAYMKALGQVLDTLQQESLAANNRR